MGPVASTIFTQLRAGDFLDRARIRRIAVIFVALSVVAVMALFATSNGFKDATGRPLGADYISFYTAGKVALKDGAGAAYDQELLYHEHQQLLQEPAPPFWPFLYPPVYIFLAMALASLPYLAGWLGWMGSTLALYVGAMQKIAPGRYAAFLALAFPAVLSNFLHGQNAFLLTALFAAATYLLSQGRGILAGVAFGLLSIKPQYGVLIPIALAASGQWRAIIAAAVTVALVAAAPAIAFGPGIWGLFVQNTADARHIIVEQGAIGFEKIQSIFSQMRMLDMPVYAAYAAQGAMMLLCAVFVFRLWRGDAPYDLKAAGLIVASLLATPYALDYDMVILAPAIAYLVRDGEMRGYMPFDRSMLLFAALSPAFTRAVASVTLFSTGLIAMILLLLIVERRRTEQSSFVRSPARLD